jgi:predicted DNA binding protein
MKGVNMNTNKTSTQVVALLSTAITASLSGDELTATKNTAQALRLLANGTVKTVATTTKKTAKAVKRGAKPLLNQTQVATMLQRVANGESVVNVAKAFNVSYQTAHRYLRNAKKAQKPTVSINN